MKLAFGATSREVKSEALEEDHKNKTKKKGQEMTKEVLEEFSRFICQASSP